MDCAIDCRISIAQIQVFWSIKEDLVQMAIQLKDIADYVGVSQGTVSRVLSNKKSGVRISDDTRKRVLQVAREFGYTPNPIARSLRTRRTATIGVIAPSNNNFSQQINTAEIIAAQKGYELIVAITRWSTEQEENEIRRLLHRMVDGLLILSPVIEGQRDKVLGELVGKGFPLVGVGPILNDSADYVDWDRQEAYKQLTEHLLERGCRKIAFLARNMTPGIQGRIDGVRAAVENNSEGVQLRLIGCQSDLRAMNNPQLEQFARKEILANRPDAVLCPSDEDALVVMHTVRKLGWSVPKEIAVTGCSNQSFGEFLEVPLTTVAMPYEKMVETAVVRIIERIENADKSFARMAKCVPADVIIRQSSMFGTRL
ncbi:MAG: LacI family DNA-binding transcriptional regulator [Planctomycetota bacterium]